jgi:hypothetical protein
LPLAQIHFQVGNNIASRDFGHSSLSPEWTWSAVSL